MILCKYMKTIMNDVHNLSDNRHVRIIIYQKVYHNSVYIVNEECRIRIFIIILMKISKESLSATVKMKMFSYF